MILRKFLSPIVVSPSPSPSPSASSRSPAPHLSSSRSPVPHTSPSRSPVPRSPPQSSSPTSNLSARQKVPPSPTNADSNDDGRFNHWYLHHTFQRRKYQCEIIREALFQNTLISLPHRFGRKYVACAIMLNFFKWFPQGKIVFVSNLHSSFSTHAKLCRKFGIEKKYISELTVSIIPGERAALWKTRRVIFVSPTVLQNDLRSGAYGCEDLKCIIFDNTQRSTLSVIRTLERVDSSIPAAPDAEADADPDSETKPLSRYRTVVLSDAVGAATALFQRGLLGRALFFGERDPAILPYYDEDAKVLNVTKTTPQVRAVCQALNERFIQYHLASIRRMGITFSPGPADEVCGDAARIMKIITAAKTATLHMHAMDLYTLYALFSCRDTLLVHGVSSFLAFVSRMGSVSYVSKYCNFHTRRDWADFVEYCKETLAPETTSHPKLKALEKFFKKYLRKHPNCKKVVILTHFEETRQDVAHWLGKLSHLVQLESDSTNPALPSVAVLLESKSTPTLSEMCEKKASRGLVVCFEYESFATGRIQCTEIKAAAKVVALAIPGEKEAVCEKMGVLGAAEKSAELAKLYNAVGTVFGPSPRMVPASVSAPSLVVLKDNRNSLSNPNAGENKRKRKPSGGGAGGKEAPVKAKPKMK